MKSYAQLENELAEAREEIRWLREAMAPPKDFRVPGLQYNRKGGASRHMHVILHALATADGHLTGEQLNVRLDVVLNHRDGVDPKTSAVTICRLRKTMAKINPSIIIKNDWGLGYYMEAESKRLVMERPEPQ